MRVKVPSRSERHPSRSRNPRSHSSAGERSPHTREVAGSKPAGTTILIIPGQGILWVLIIRCLRVGFGSCSTLISGNAVVFLFRIQLGGCVSWGCWGNSDVASAFTSSTVPPPRFTAFAVHRGLGGWSSIADVIGRSGPDAGYGHQTGTGGLGYRGVETSQRSATFPLRRTSRSRPACSGPHRSSGGKEPSARCRVWIWRRQSPVAHWPTAVSKWAGWTKWCSA